VTAELFEFGYFSKVIGLKGELGLKTHDPSSRAPFEIDRMVVRRKSGLGDTTHGISSVREGSAGLVVVTLEGITTREAAEGCVGGKALCFRAELSPCAPGEYFMGDLIGLEAFDEAGAALGAVAEIWDSGPVPNLVVHAAGKEELMVPFVEDFIVSVDLSARRVVLRPPEYG
jgi:16S rRNA processing protein RimM